MLRIGICDDSVDARCALSGLLEQYIEIEDLDCRIYEFSSGEGILRWMDRHTGELDLIFLDIEMGELNGMETARRLRAMDEGLQLVFVTGYDQYVFDGYSVGALGYLMKPATYEKLADIMVRAMSALLRNEKQTFLCRSGDTFYRIPKKNILYFYSDRRLIHCVTTGQTYTFYGKLDDVAAGIGSGFVRIHQRYLVRGGAVDRLDGSEVCIGTATLPVSRAYRSTAMAALARVELEV